MVNYIIGAMLILIGIAISRFPNLLIVYSQMGEQEREKLEKEGFLKLCKKAFIRVGIITIVVQAIFNQSHWTILVPLVGVLRIVFLLYMKKRELVGTKKMGKCNFRYRDCNFSATCACSYIQRGKRTRSDCR